jgi:predicted dehydrogenase
VSWLDPKKVRQVTVVGTRKMAIYDDVAEEKLRIYDCGVNAKEENNGPGQSIHEMPISYRYGDIVSPQIQFQEPLKLEDQHFIDCIRHRSESLSDGRSGLVVVATLEAIDEAIMTGGAVKIRTGISLAATKSKATAH